MSAVAVEWEPRAVLPSARSIAEAAEASQMPGALVWRVAHIPDDNRSPQLRASAGRRGYWLACCICERDIGKSQGVAELTGTEARIRSGVCLDCICADGAIIRARATSTMTHAWRSSTSHWRKTRASARATDFESVTMYVDEIRTLSALLAYGFSVTGDEAKAIFAGALRS